MNMKYIWNKISKLYLNDWSQQEQKKIAHFALLDRDTEINSWKDLIALKSFLNLNKSLTELLYFLKQENLCPVGTILEVAIMNDEWGLVLKLTELEDIQFCYLGHKRKYHLHEVIFSRVLDLLKENRFPPEEFYKLVNLRVKRKYLGVGLFERLKQTFVEEMKNCQTRNAVAITSPFLKNLLEFVFFLRDNDLLIDEFFSRLVKNAIRYRNLYILKYLEDYLPPEFPWLVIASLKYEFVLKVFQEFPQRFLKQNYIRYVIKCYFDSAIAEETEVYRIISWLKENELDNTGVDESLLTLILGAVFHSHSKVLLINFLISIKILPKNKFLLDNLKHLHKVHPLVFEALISGDDVKTICQTITSCKSGNKILILEPLLMQLNEEESQNKILFSYITTNKLKINHNLVFNYWADVPSLKSFNPVVIQQLLFVLSFYNPRRQLKLLLSLRPGHDRDIQESYETLSIIRNSDCMDVKIPAKPKTIPQLKDDLVPLKKMIQTANINLGIDNFASGLEKLKFKNFNFKVPRTAQDLRKVGLTFKNCLARDYHSRYVSDIILKNVIVFTLESENENYCVSIDLYNRKIAEAKKQGQEMMPASLKSSLEFFLREIDYGFKWL